MGNLINVMNYPVPHKNQNGGTGGGVTYVTYNGSSSSSNNGDNVNATYIMASDGKILRLEGEELTYNYGKIGELESDNIIAGKINADEMDVLKAWIEKLDSKEITTEYLTVTKQAHFFELIIDKVRAVGGQIILTPAQAAIDKVFAYDSNGNLVSDPVSYFNSVHHFDVYWRALDSEGRGISNDWVAGDQAYCQSFNVTAGVHHDVSNKYYWRLVNAVLPDKMINFSTNEIQDINNPTTSVTTNNISISMEYTTYEDVPTNISWEVRPMVEHAGVEWDNVGPNATYAVRGTMSTSSTSLGINILPTGEYAYIPSDTLKFHIYNVDGNIAQSNINIGVYFKDGTSIFFPNVEFDSNFNKTLDLKSPDMEIEAIAIVCTQPVQWNQCHGIRLSNTDMDHYVDAKGATPETGDNIVQLGYRPNDDANRRSAIIIAAYKTPDPDLTAPSYAQYIGINDYNLKSHRQSYFDANGAVFLGDITLAKYGNTNLRSQFTITTQGIQTWVGQQDYANKSYVGSQISQSATSIQTWVGQQDYANKSYVGSQITQSQNSITSWVGQQNYATQSFVGSQITQSQNNITSWVGQQNYATQSFVGSKISQSQSDIQLWVKNNLQNTGINIQDGTIILQANKTIFQNASGNVTWLSGKLNGVTKWDLQIFNSKPWMCFGSYTNMTQTTYITSDIIHINTDGNNDKYAELNVLSDQPSLRLYKKNKAQIQLYINNEGNPTLYLCRYMNGSSSNTREAWIYIDSNGRIQFKVSPSSMWVNEHTEGHGAVDRYTPYGSLYISDGSTAQLKY